MANYTSKFTGAQIDLALDNAATLGQSVTLNVVASGITFRRVVWEAAPTSSNDVYGLAVHPTDGKLYRIRNNKGTYSAQVYGAGGGIEASVDQDGTLNFTQIS